MAVSYSSSSRSFSRETKCLTSIRLYLSLRLSRHDTILHCLLDPIESRCAMPKFDFSIVFTLMQFSKRQLVKTAFHLPKLQRWLTPMRNKQIGPIGNRHWTCKKERKQKNKKYKRHIEFKRERQKTWKKESHRFTDKKIYKQFSFPPILLVPPLSTRLVIVVNGSVRQWR